MISSASVELEIPDDEYFGHEEAVGNRLNEQLDKLIRADLQDAHLVTSNDHDETFVHDYWTLTEKRRKNGKP
jgi:hypothetical protein